MPQRIIDTHVHVWNFERAGYPWLERDTSILNRSYHIAELEEERKKAGITDGILVQAANNMEDTEWMLEVAKGSDWIRGVVGWLPLQDPEAVTSIIEEKYLSEPLIKGIRHLIHNENDDRWLLGEKVVESLTLLQKFNYPYDLVGINLQHIRTALELADKLPGLQMVFDHMNQPPIAAKEKFGEWGELMRTAASHPAFHIKISGLGTASGNFTGWRAEDLRPYIEFALEQFGEDRCFCGGDWPVSLLAGSYSGTWSAYRSIIDSLLDESQQNKVYYENASLFYRVH